MKKKLSFDIPKPLANGQCNPKCPFFVAGNVCIGCDDPSDDYCDMGYGRSKRVKREHPVDDIYVNELFPFKGCPWHKE